MVLLFLGCIFPLDFSLFFFLICFCCPKILSVTIHFGRLSDQIGYISWEVVSSYFLITPTLVVVCLAFRVKGNLHVWELFLKEGGRGAAPGSLQLTCSMAVWKTGTWENKNDVYEKCLIKMFVIRLSLRLVKLLIQSTGKCLLTQYLDYSIIPGTG